MSGLSRTPGKRVWVYPHRGFESRPLRQAASGPMGPFCFWSLAASDHPPALTAVRPRESAIRRATLVCPLHLPNTAADASQSARREAEMSRMLKGWMISCLAFGLVAGGLPAEASEVVKLARLDVSGKRSPSEAPRTVPVESRPASTSPQAHGSGGSDNSGTAPSPSRGVS